MNIYDLLITIMFMAAAGFIGFAWGIDVGSKKD